jgi:hypothetical protein
MECGVKIIFDADACNYLHNLNLEDCKMRLRTKALSFPSGVPAGFEAITIGMFGETIIEAPTTESPAPYHCTYIGCQIYPYDTDHITWAEIQTNWQTPECYTPDWDESKNGAFRFSATLAEITPAWGNIPLISEIDWNDYNAAIWSDYDGNAEEISEL